MVSCVTLSVSHMAVEESWPFQRCFSSLRFAALVYAQLSEGPTTAFQSGWGLDFDWTIATPWFFSFSHILLYRRLTARGFQVRSSSWGLSVWSLHVLPVNAWVLSGCSGFLPPSKNMHVRLIGVSKLSLGLSVSVHGCLPRLSLCGPVMDWRPVQGVPRLSPDDRWDRLQPPRDPTDGWKENFGFLKPRPYFLFEIRLSTHREQFGKDRRPLRAI